MMASSRRMAAGAAVLALFGAGSAAAQENLDEGKTPAQLYTANCAICHKSPRGLAKAGGMLGLQGFLREHYTASKETAAAIAAYLVTVDSAAPPPARASKRAGKPKEKSTDKSKAGDAKSAKPAKDQGEAKDAEPKTSEPKSTKPSEAAPADAGAKPAEAKAEASKPAANKPAAQAKPETETETEKKSD